MFWCWSFQWDEIYQTKCSHVDVTFSWADLCCNKIISFLFCSWSLQRNIFSPVRQSVPVDHCNGRVGRGQPSLKLWALWPIKVTLEHVNFNQLWSTWSTLINLKFMSKSISPTSEDNGVHFHRCRSRGETTVRPSWETGWILGMDSHLLISHLGRQVGLATCSCRFVIFLFRSFHLRP